MVDDLGRTSYLRACGRIGQLAGWSSGCCAQFLKDVSAIDCHGARKILLLVNDEALREFMLAFLEGQLVTIVTSPFELPWLLQHNRYVLVIITNFGVRP